MKYYDMEYKEKIRNLWFLGKYSSFNDFARQMDIPESTLRKWIRIQDRGKDRELYFSLSFKIDVLHKWSKIAEEDRGIWLRTHGHTEEELASWEHEVTMSKDKEFLEDKQKIRELTRTNQLLQKELDQKNIALADLAARLILQKKIQSYLGDLEADSLDQK